MMVGVVESRQYCFIDSINDSVGRYPGTVSDIGNDVSVDEHIDSLFPMQDGLD